jgi:signal transduction histidine kinase
MRASIAVAAGTTTVVTLLLAFGAGDVLELPARDAVLRLLPQRAAAHTIIVAIDERSISERAWPWSRELLAQIVDRAADAGSRAVIFDVLLPESREGDERLAQAMRRIPTIAVAVLDERHEWILPAPVLRDAVIPAHGSFELDRDGVLRRFASTKQSRDRSLAALPLEAASIITSAPVPVGRSIAPAFRTPPRSVPQVSAGDLLRNVGGASGLPSRLRGKLVFIGPTAYALSDRVVTPVSRGVIDPGVTVHAAATEALIRGETIHEMPPIVAGLIAGVVAGVIVIAKKSRGVRLAIAGALAIVVIASAVVLLDINGIALPYVTWLFTIVIVTTGVEAQITLASLRRSETQLQEIATKIAEVRAQEAESKRVLAHELKTPLASMRGLTQLLGGFELTDAERKRVATLLATEAGKLESMVHGLLDLERLPLRDFAASSSVVNLGELFAARAEFLRAGTDRTLNVSIQPDLFVRADAALLERVIDNLAGNALKYSPPHTPVAINVRQFGAAAVLEVEDRGFGIPAEERERIFRRFARGSAAKGTEGLGLGLSLVAEVARWHGGSVSVDDADGGGARFRVSLPAVMAAELEGRTPSPAQRTERTWRASS